MWEKIILGFYNVLSWIVWAVIIVWIFFMLFLLITGSRWQPDFEIISAQLTEAGPDDAILAANGCSGDGWYKLELDMTVRGSDLSPYEYIINGFNVKGNDYLKYSCEGFVEVRPDIVFSRAETADFTVLYYVNYPNSEQELIRELETAGFGARSIKQKLGFLKTDIKINVPGFYLDGCEIAAESAAA